MTLTRRTFLGSSAAAVALLPLSFNPLRAQSGTGAKRKLGIALVGLGRYSTYELAPAIQEAPSCRLAAVVTGDRGKGLTWAGRHEFPESSIYSYDTMGELASNSEVDAVYVVTPPGLHRQHVERAAAAGKHVICEKPMATTAADCAAMIESCRRAGRQLAIGYRLHFDPYHQELMRLARTREFGAFKLSRGGHGFTVSQKSWRINKALAGGGPLPDVGIYALHAACMAAQADPVAVTARELPKTRPEFFSEVEEAIEWTLEFPDGSRGEGKTSYNAGMNFFRAEGDQGWFSLEPAFAYRGIQGRTSSGALTFAPVRQQAQHIEAIANALLEGRPVPTPGALGLRDVRLIEAIYESARSGNRVEITG